MHIARFTRSRHNAVIAGVCGGIARHKGIRTLPVRIGFAIAGLFGIGIVVYLIAWIVFPKRPSTRTFELANQSQFENESD